MNCWICGAKADSREHFMKASDVRGAFGGISQSKPIYKHKKGHLNQPVGSSKSKAITSKAPVCSECNNRRTQPYDKAWEKLSAHLRASWPDIRKSGRVNLTKVFPGGTHEAALDVHLFFVKLFGCLIVESDLPIALDPFRNALLNRQPHPEVCLAISEAPMSDQLYAYVTDVNALQNQVSFEAAGWMYIFSPFAIFVGYKASASIAPGWPRAWRPATATKHVKLSPYRK